MTSAVRVEGERLYKKAHRGETVDTPTRPVTVHRAELLESDEERASFEIECSSGTYIRTLVETLEDAYCESLRRTAIGALRLPEDDEEEISVEELMGFLPEVALDAEAAERASHGVALPGPAEQHVRLTHEGRLIAIARPDEGKLRPEVVLA
jgi:tRNA pseudouridine55 synthase